MGVKAVWDTEHYLRMQAAVLDATGVILMAVAIVQIESRRLDAKNIEDLEKELNDERASEGIWSIVGIIFIVLGFASLVAAESFSWYKFSKRATTLSNMRVKIN